MTETAFLVDGILTLDEYHVAEILADRWTKWLNANDGNLPETYVSPTVMIGVFSGTRHEDDGLFGTFTCAGRSYNVVDSIVNFPLE